MEIKKVVVAIDSWKGSLSSLEAGEAIRRGISRIWPEAEVKVSPLADGGEGTAYALTAGMGGNWVEIEATGPLGGPVKCGYGILKEKKLALMEMSAAAGLTLLTEAERNPMETTTYGVGEMIADAIKRGCRNFIVGIGGSATNDGGIGMLQALGFQMCDKKGRQVPFGAKGLAVLSKIRTEGVIPELSECTFQIACDVTNVLCGEQGCSAVYGPQKGADDAMIARMDQWLMQYARLAGDASLPADWEQPGTGAAGGLGFAFLTFTRARLMPGVQVVLNATHLAEEIETADLVITGEGRLDRQTAMGKAPMGVAQIARQFHKPVIAFAGCAGKDACACHDAGIDAYFPVLREAVTLEEAMEPSRAAANLEETAEQVFRLLKACYG